METKVFDRSERTAVRHGGLNAFLEYLKECGFSNPIVTDAQREDLGKLPQAKRIYGALQEGDKILFIEKPAAGGMPTKFYNIQI